MKKNLLLSLAVIFFMASCSSKISLVKRKYNKGFYVSVNKNNQSAATPRTMEAPRHLAQEQPSMVKTEIVPSLVKPSAVVAAVVSEASQPAPSANKSAKLNKSASVTANAGAPVIAPAKIRPLNAAMRDAMTGAAAASDTNKVLLIILALFPILSLIAVYLHDGSVTLNFWVTLLLHFIFIYWLFALLVVLDVINLA